MRSNPFPHVVLDDFLLPSEAQLLLDFFPAKDSPVWKTPENLHTKLKSVMREPKIELFAPEVRHIFEYLNCSTILGNLTSWFGIKGLVPDPYFAEGG